MLEPRPPRRDPRLLLVEKHAGRVGYVALDAWEVRGLGVLPRASRAASTALACILLQVRPSVVAVSQLTPDLRRVLAAAAALRGLPILAITPRERRDLLAQAPTIGALRAQYRALPESLGRALAHTFRLAVAVLTTRSFPPRRYVSRLVSRATPRLGS